MYSLQSKLKKDKDTFKLHETMDPLAQVIKQRKIRELADKEHQIVIEAYKQYFKTVQVEAIKQTLLQKINLKLAEKPIEIEEESLVLAETP